MLPLKERISQLEKVSGDPQFIKELVDADPSKTKALIGWMFDQITSKGIIKEDVLPTVKLFWSSKPRLPENQRDILFYKDAKHLENTLKNLGSSKRSLRKYVKEQGAIRYFENDKWVIVQLLDKAGAVFWGKGTRWCISMANADFFKDYTSSKDKSIPAPFFFVCQRKDLGKDKLGKFDKFACYFKAHIVNNRLGISLEIYDAQDNCYSELPLPKGFSEIEKEVWNFVSVYISSIQKDFPNGLPLSNTLPPLPAPSTVSETGS